MVLTIPNSTMGQRNVDNTVAILLGAYQKHAAELLAIENSQEKLIAAIIDRVKHESLSE